MAGAAIVLYGGGMGIRSIVRGSVPLAVFGAEGYASLMGRIAMPGLLVGAVSPFLARSCSSATASTATLAVLTAAAVVGVVLSVVLLLDLRQRTAAEA